MAESNVSSTTPKKRGRPPKTKVAEVCSIQSTEVTHELSSYNSVFILLLWDEYF